MKKKFMKWISAFALLIGGGVGVASLTGVDANACTKCSTSNYDRKCGECNSTRLFSVKEEWKRGKLYTTWECSDCKHSFKTYHSNGKEVVIK